MRYCEYMGVAYDIVTPTDKSMFLLIISFELSFLIYVHVFTFFQVDEKMLLHLPKMYTKASNPNFERPSKEKCLSFINTWESVNSLCQDPVQRGRIVKTRAPFVPFLKIPCFQPKIVKVTNLTFYVNWNRIECPVENSKREWAGMLYLTSQILILHPVFWL